MASYTAIDNQNTMKFDCQRLYLEKSIKNQNHTNTKFKELPRRYKGQSKTILLALVVKSY